MPISSTNRKAGPFPGDGVQDTFPFEFKVFSDADLLVVRADSNGAEYTLVLTTDYTVALNPDQEVDPGGEVVLVAPLPLLESVVVTSDVANLQPIDITNQGGFYPAVMNSALDRLTILSQQLEEKVSRSIKVTITSDLTPDEFVQELQQGASEASASAAAAAASAALAETFVPAGYAQLTGATFTGHIEVPAGASGAQAPRAQEVAPPGLLAFFARNTAPAGWLKANGATVSRATYAELFTAIGTSFGVGDGSTTFGLPDLRGEFPRGWDDARGVDSGRAFGSAQADSVKEGTFNMRRTGDGFTTASSATGVVTLSTSAGTTVTLSATATSHPMDVIRIGAGNLETRGRNIALLACIKY